jgi:hypothetical protein
MKKVSVFTTILAVVLLMGTVQRASAQSSKLYKEMSVDEQKLFVDEQARRIAREMSGREYEFTPEFTAIIQRAVEFYARRIGNNTGDRPGKGEARFIFKRGQIYAPMLISTFKGRSVSPLIGLYIPLIESEYVNLQTPNMVGALGVFQFLPSTGKAYGLSPEELLNVEKSADAAARYIVDSLNLFPDDPMKEALAILAYNRGGNKVIADVAAQVNERNRNCSICALTAASAGMDTTFQAENVYYVPRFFAAAIIGENPRAFDLQTRPLSSYAAQ